MHTTRLRVHNGCTASCWFTSIELRVQYIVNKKVEQMISAIVPKPFIPSFRSRKCFLKKEKIA